MRDTVEIHNTLKKGQSSFRKIEVIFFVLPNGYTMYFMWALKRTFERLEGGLEGISLSNSAFDLLLASKT